MDKGMTRGLACPHCGGMAMRPKAKLMFAPLLERPCDSCGKSLAVDWWPSVLASLAWAALIFFALLSFPAASAWLGLGVGLTAFAAAHVYLVPLAAPAR